MATPALNIPIRADLADFKKAMNESTTAARAATKQVLKEFTDLNAQLGGPILAGMTANFGRAALSIASKFALVIGTFKLTADIVQSVRDQIKSMVDVAEKSTARGLSPEFFQQFMEGAKGAKDQVTLFEGALTHAFTALKPILSPDWSVWDAGITKVNAIETEMRGFRELFTTDQASSGLDMFRKADTNDQKIIAVLTYMQQLEAIGQRVAALDLGDKLFGSSFTDQIRTGKASIDDLLTSVKTRSETMFSNNAVQKAKELDDQLREAWRTVDKNLHPSLEALDVVALKIKSVWVDIVKLMGEAAKLLPGISSPGLSPNGIVQARAEETRLQGRLRDQGLTGSQRSGLEAQLRDVQSKLAQAEASQVPMAPTEINAAGTEKIPLPQRRPDDIPKPTPAAATPRDRFETGADLIEKRTAALNAETQTLGLNTAAQERAKVAASLFATARQFNKEAGLGENVVTEQQRQRIEEVASAYEKAAQGLEKMRVGKEIAFGRGTAFLSSEDANIAQQLRGLYGDDIPAALGSSEAAALRLNDAFKSIAGTMEGSLTSGLTDILDHTKTVGEGFAAMSKTIVRAFEEAAVKMLVVQPAMRLLAGSLGLADGGPVSTIAVGSYQMPQFASGGPISGPGTSRSDSIPLWASDGEYIVNAESTAKYRGLIELINADALPKFADGGAINSSGSAPIAVGGTTIAPTIAVSVQGSPGMSDADHERMGANIGRAVNDQLQAMIARELRTQTRPGGILRR